MSQTQTSQFHQPPTNNTPKDLAQSSEASDAQDRHLLLVDDDKGRRVFQLDAEVYSIGRDPSCHIRLFSMFVSRQHATLRRMTLDDGSFRYQIVDGNLQGQRSTNKISINGRPISTYELKDGDRVMFGGNAGVKAEYYRQKEDNKSGPLDPYDVTLIDPSTLANDEDELKQGSSMAREEDKTSDPILANDEDELKQGNSTARKKDKNPNPRNV